MPNWVPQSPWRHTHRGGGGGRVGGVGGVLEASPRCAHAHAHSPHALQPPPAPRHTRTLSTPTPHAHSECGCPRHSPPPPPLTPALTTQMPTHTLTMWLSRRVSAPQNSSVRAMVSPMMVDLSSGGRQAGGWGVGGRRKQCVGGRVVGCVQQMLAPRCRPPPLPSHRHTPHLRCPTCISLATLGEEKSISTRMPA